MSKFQFRQSPFKMIFFLYILLVLVFSGLFLLPFSRVAPLGFIDSFFLSSSAISATGLSPVKVSETLSHIGQIFLLIEIQIGGIGIMALLGSMMLMFKANVSLPSQTLMVFDQNQKTSQSVMKLMRFIVVYTLSVELVGFLIILPFVWNHEQGWYAVFSALFLSVSSFTNAGFDLFDNGISIFLHEPIIILTLTLLIILGVLGFPMILEMLFSKQKKKSLFFKVNLTTHISLLIAGFLFFFFVDIHSMNHLSFLDKLIYSLFYSASPRSGGMTPMDLGIFTMPSLLMMMILMFIGGSPSSCSGGIRTSTFAVILAKLFSTIKGSNDTHIYKKTLYDEDVNKAFLIFFSFFFLFLFTFIGLSIFEHIAPFPLAFEIMSALTTSGLSMGVTGDLSIFSEIWLSLLMIVGRIGVVVLIYTFIETKPSTLKYAKESIIIG